MYCYSVCFRGRLKKRGSSDMAYNPMKLSELNNRRPYPFLNGMLSSMHYQSTPQTQPWSAYPDHIQTKAASALDNKQTTQCGGKMPSALSTRILCRGTSAPILNMSRANPAINTQYAPPNVAMTSQQSCTQTMQLSPRKMFMASQQGCTPRLQFENASPVGSPDSVITGGTSPSSAGSQSPANISNPTYSQQYEGLSPQANYMDISKYLASIENGHCSETVPGIHTGVHSNQSSVHGDYSARSGNHTGIHGNINHNFNNGIYANHSTIHMPSNGYQNRQTAYQQNTYCAPTQKAVPLMSSSSYGVPYATHSQMYSYNTTSQPSRIQVPANAYPSSCGNLLVQ